MQIDDNAYEWLNKNQLSYDIWERKYRYNGETFDEWLDRVSGGDKDVRQLIKEKKFLFGGRTLSNRGTDKKGSYSNCYSRGYIQDNLDDLMQAATDIAMTFKAQGGQGLSLSKIRPKGAPINHGQFTSDGIIPFMEIYNRITESISQGGSRKGALLMSLDVWHKEAEDFIKIKSEEGRIQKANLSLEIDDEFMQTVKNDFINHTETVIPVTREYGGEVITYEVTPIKLYRLMIEKAWDWGEPGCLFTNRFRHYHMMNEINSFQIETCNPCGEQPLKKNSACNLGSMNLSEYVIHPFTPEAYFDFDSFREGVTIAIRGLDQIIDENKDNHALLEQKETSIMYRNIGLGIMGLYDALAKMRMTYGSLKSIEFADSLMGFMFRTAVIASGQLAKEYGPFPGYESKMLNSKIIRKHFTPQDLEFLEITTYGLRNCSLLSIAPSGSIGTMLDVSTGCEPAFNISYQRKTESLHGNKDKYYTVYMGIAKEYFEANKHHSLDNVHPDILPPYFVVAGDINWKQRVNMQAALQEHVDTAISSTVNLRHDITVDEIEQLYLYAWEKGLKGITIFRDGCKRTGILTTNKKEGSTNQTDTNTNTKKPQLKRGMILKVNNDTIGKERHLQTGCGTLHMAAFFDPFSGDLLECYLSKGSQGGCQSNLAGISRMISLSARGGIDVYSIADQLHSCPTCPAYAVRHAKHKDTSKGDCCPSAIANALIEMYEEMKADIDDLELDGIEDIPVKESPAYQEESIPSLKCPECGEDLIMEGGCMVCHSCGYSKCE